MRKSKKTVAVIGGGASGLVAALFAADAGCSIVLFEKQKALGRKLRITGNGRCNITNRDIDATHYHGHNPMFVKNIFARFGLDATIDFFESIGIPFCEGEGGRLYPASLQASSVVKILEYEARRRGVDVLLHRKVDRIALYGGRVRLITAGKEEFDVDSAVLAAGSCAYSPLGASRSGYELAISLGHRVYEPFPSILPLTIPLKALHRLEGIKWDCRLSVILDGKIIAQSEEETLFTRYGISGPAALEISRAVNEAMTRGAIPEVNIDFFPRMDSNALISLLDSLWDDGDRPIGFSLLGILKERMPAVVLHVIGVDPEMPVRAATAAQRSAIAAALKEFRVVPGEPRGFGEAVVAAGGVDVDQIHPATMESKIARGVHITGELLDIDGDSGGYNLQFAWSTGAIAGMAQ